MTRRGAMKSIGASFLKLVPARDDADRARGGDEPPARGEDPIVEVAAPEGFDAADFLSAARPAKPK